MKIHRLFFPLVLVLFSLPLFAQKDTIPPSLRGGIKADAQTIQTALAMQEQGWEYVMPVPKSSKAAWGNYDGRTTWWEGYWHNSKSGVYSSSTPTLKSGKYVSDGVDGRGWRRGGSPPPPSKLEWLLSKRGGIPPR